MASVFDIFKRTSTLDPKKDYAFTISESSKNDLSDEMKARVKELYGLDLDEYKKGGDSGDNKTIGKNSDVDSGKQSTNSSINNSTGNMGGDSTIESETISQLQNEIKELKSANRKLANNKPISSPETVEDMIYSLCVGKETRNGSWEATGGTVTE